MACHCQVDQWPIWIVMACKFDVLAYEFVVIACKFVVMAYKFVVMACQFIWMYPLPVACK